MRQEVAVGIDELVDPLHPDRPVVHRLYRERRGVVEQQSSPALCRDGTVSPHDGGGQSGRKDLLRELPHRDLVVVRRLAAGHRDGASARHYRRDEQRGLVLGHRRRHERAPGDLGQGYCPAAGKVGVEHEAGPGSTHRLDERPPTERPAEFVATHCHRTHPHKLAGLRPPPMGAVSPTTSMMWRDAGRLGTSGSSCGRTQSRPRLMSRPHRATDSWACTVAARSRATASACSTVAASTMTRTSGSVPEGRRSTRPVAPRPPSAAATAACNTGSVPTLDLSTSGTLTST